MTQEKVRISYLDFGKPFNADSKRAGEFTELAYTSDLADSRSRSILIDNVLNLPKSTPFRRKGALTVACAPAWDNQIMFAIVQGRTENELLSGIGVETGRFFYQIRFMLLKKIDAVSALSKGYSLFFSLYDGGLEVKDNVYTLKEYNQREGEKKYLDLKLDKAEQKNCYLIGENRIFTVPNNVLEVAEKLISAQKEGKKELRIISNISLSEKLKIADAVQRLVYNKIGWIRFSLDYVSQSTASDGIALLFLESDQDSNNIPAPYGGYEKLQWKSDPKLQVITSYFNVIKKTLVGKPFEAVNHKLITGTRTFWEWLVVSSESQYTPEELAEQLLKMISKKDFTVKQIKLIEIKNQKVWEILDAAFTKGNLKELQLLFEEIKTPEAIFEEIPTEKLEKWVRQYIHNNDFNEKVYDLSKYWVDHASYREFTIGVALFSMTKISQGQDLDFWVKKSYISKEKSDAIRFLSPNLRSMSMTYQDAVNKFASSVGSDRITNDMKETLAKLIEEYDNQKEPLPENQASATIKTKPNFAILGEKIESFLLNERNPYPKTIELLNSLGTKPIDLLKEVTSVEARYLLSTVNEYNDLSQDVQQRLIRDIEKIRNKSFYSQSANDDVTVSHKPDYSKPTPNYLQKTTSTTSKPNKKIFRFLLTALFISIIIWVSISILPTIFSQVWLTSFPYPSSTPVIVTTHKTAKTKIPPTISSTPDTRIIEASDFPIGAVVFNDSEKQGVYYFISGDSSPNPIDFKNVDFTTDTTILDQENKCLKHATLLTEPYLFRAFNYLLLSLSYQCPTGEYKTARIYLDQSLFSIRNGRFLDPDGVERGNNVFNLENTLQGLTQLIIQSPRFITQDTVSVLARQEPVPNFSYLVIYNIRWTKWQIISFEEQNSSTVIRKGVGQIPNAPTSNIFQIKSYAWANNDSLLVVLNRNNTFQWLYLPFDFKKIDAIDQEMKSSPMEEKNVGFLDFSVRENGDISFIYSDNGQYYFKLCTLNPEHIVVCDKKSILLSNFKDLYQVMWSPDGQQIAFSASLADGVKIQEQDKVVEQNCSLGCLFLADVNIDGTLGQVKWVKNITSGITNFWWIDPTNLGK